MQHKQLEEEELSLLEKKKQREVARKEITNVVKFKTTVGKYFNLLVSLSLFVSLSIHSQWLCPLIVLEWQ